MTFRRTWVLPIAGLAVLTVLVACGGGGSGSSGGSSSPTTTYTVGGTVSGLSGAVVLQNNASNDLTVSANGSFAFTAGLTSGTAYAVTVKTHPSSATRAQNCLVTSGSGSVSSSNVTGVTVACTTTMINGAVLPPDPGEAGKATIAGIDSDNDGVRDDVEIWIATTYPNSARVRSALTQHAVALQSLMTGASSVDTNRQAILDAIACVSNTVMSSGADVAGGALANKMEEAAESLVVNTTQRIQAYATANDRLSGSAVIFPGFATGQSRCVVDPATLPN